MLISQHTGSEMATFDCLSFLKGFFPEPVAFSPTLHMVCAFVHVDTRALPFLRIGHLLSLPSQPLFSL